MAHVEIHDAGLVIPTPVVYVPQPDLTGADVADRLERQNICRWTLDRSPWDRTLTANPPDTWEVIEFATETITGDTYSEPAAAFQAGVPGYYNIKAAWECLISAPAIETYKVKEFRFGYTMGGGSWVTLGGVLNHQYPTNNPTYLRGAILSGADTVGIAPGQQLQFGWRYSIFTGGTDILYFEEFKARFLVEKVADLYVNSGRCC